MQLGSPALDNDVRPTLLWVDTDEIIARYGEILTEQFSVSTRAGTSEAIGFLRCATTAPDFVVTDLGLPDGLAYQICLIAKALSVPATVLVTASVADQVPDALAAGCDSVLLKPFAPNLLLSRLARLKRSRLAARAKAELARAKTDHFRERLLDVGARIFREWPDSECPHCGHAGTTCFEYASYRRAWYACLACKKVWLSARPE